MSGQVLSTSTGAVGVAVLPATGSTRPLFIAAAALLAGGLIALTVTLVRKSEAK
jgi:LPXTG-motif cell wall-anchored protein